MKFQKYISVLFACLGLMACEKEKITKDLKFYESDVFIESLLEPETLPKVFVSNSIPFFSPNIKPTVLFARNAKVTISSTNGIDSLKADSTFSYLRCRWEPFYLGSTTIQYGLSYSLTVVNVGEVYTATTTIKQGKPVITSTDYVEEFYDVYGEHEGVVIDFQDAIGEANAYRYRLDRSENEEVYEFGDFDGVKCLTSDSVELRETGRSIFLDDNLDGRVLNIVFEPVIKHTDGSTGQLVIQSLDAKAAIFYDQLDKQKLADRNPFIEPVYIDSHIDGCLGIFGSVVNSDPVTFVYPE